MITDYDAAAYAQTAQGFRHVLRIREISGRDYNRKVAPRGDGRRGNDLRARRRNQCNRQLDYILIYAKIYCSYIQGLQENKQWRWCFVKIR